MRKPGNFSIILLEQTVIRRETPVILVMTQMCLSHGAETKEHELFIDHNHQVVLFVLDDFFIKVSGLSFWLCQFSLTVSHMFFLNFIIPVCVILLSSPRRGLLYSTRYATAAAVICL